MGPWATRFCIILVMPLVSCNQGGKIVYEKAPVQSAHSHDNLTSKTTTNTNPSSNCKTATANPNSQSADGHTDHVHLDGVHPAPEDPGTKPVENANCTSVNSQSPPSNSTQQPQTKDTEKTPVTSPTKTPTPTPTPHNEADGHAH